MIDSSNRFWLRGRFGTCLQEKPFSVIGHRGFAIYVAPEASEHLRRRLASSVVPYMEEAFLRSSLGHLRCKDPLSASFDPGLSYLHQLYH